VGRVLVWKKVEDVWREHPKEVQVDVVSGRGEVAPDTQVRQSPIGLFPRRLVRRKERGKWF
jgi:hypothetical protein